MDSLEFAWPALAITVILLGAVIYSLTFEKKGITTMMNEVWRDVAGYEELYKVSNLEHVSSLDRIDSNERYLKGKKLKPRKNGRGYLYVNLCRNGKEKATIIHRLVGKTFIPNPYSYPEINHKNEIKTDNRVKNLEWCSRKYNNNYGHHNEKVAKALTNGPCSKPVLQLTLDGSLVKRWPSTMECGRCDFTQQSVVDCCNGKRHTHKGYRWQYAKKEDK